MTWPRIASLASAVALACLGCPKEGGEGQSLVRQGELAYQLNCTSCHSRNPAIAGPVGPAVAGSSLELLQAKVLRNEYPPGYTPKREGGGMIALPHLEPEIPALAAYLRSVEP